MPRIGSVRRSVIASDRNPQRGWPVSRYDLPHYVILFLAARLAVRLLPRLYRAANAAINRSPPAGGYRSAWPRDIGFAWLRSARPARARGPTPSPKSRRKTPRCFETPGGKPSRPHEGVGCSARLWTTPVLWRFRKRALPQRHDPKTIDNRSQPFIVGLWNGLSHSLVYSLCLYRQ